MIFNNEILEFKLELVAPCHNREKWKNLKGAYLQNGEYDVEDDLAHSLTCFNHYFNCLFQMILSDNSKPQAINGSHSIALARLYYELRKEFCLEVEFNLFQIYSNRTKIDWNI